VKYYVRVNGRPYEVELVERLGALEVHVDGRPADVSYREVDNLGQVALVVDQRAFAVSIEGDERACLVTVAGHSYAVEVEDEREQAAHAAEGARGRQGGVVKSVMSGVVVQLLVAPGDAVEKGQPLLILEAMKMQNEIGAPADGVVRAVHVEESQAVTGGTKLVTLA